MLSRGTPTSTVVIPSRVAVMGPMVEPQGTALLETKSWLGTPAAAQAEQALITGQVDAIAVGRAALRDPYLPLRWAADLGARSWDEAPWPIQYWRGTWR